MKLVAVTGRPEAGKTTGLDALVRQVGAAGYSVGGVLQDRQVLPSGRRAYHVRCVQTMDRALVAVVGVPGGSVHFHKEGFVWAAERIVRPVQLCVVDELGWLEAEGQGHWPAVMQVLARDSTLVLVVSVRSDLLEHFSARLPFEDVWRVEPGHPAAIDLWRDRVVEFIENEALASR